MGELKASVEVDFSKAEMRLQEMDRRQRSEDSKAAVLERRAARIGERLREADSQAKRLESQLNTKLGSIAKRQGKAALSAFAFDTLNNLTEGIDNQTLKGISSIAVEGLTSLAQSGNPYVAAISAAMKAVEVLKAAQTRLADDLRSLKRDTAERFADTERIRASRERDLEKENFDEMKERLRINAEVDKENNELIWRTWGLMAGGGGN